MTITPTASPCRSSVVSQSRNATATSCQPWLLLQEKPEEAGTQILLGNMLEQLGFAEVLVMAFSPCSVVCFLSVLCFRPGSTCRRKHVVLPSGTGLLCRRFSGEPLAKQTLKRLQGQPQDSGTGRGQRPISGLVWKNWSRVCRLRRSGHFALTSFARRTSWSSHRLADIHHGSHPYETLIF